MNTLERHSTHVQGMQSLHCCFQANAPVSATEFAQRIIQVPCAPCLQVRRVDEEWDSVQSDLMRIRDTLLQRKGAFVNLTADDRTLSAVRPHLNSFLGTLPATSAGPVQWSSTLTPLNEAITVPTQVEWFGH